MKLLWLCNSAPGVVRAHISGKPASGVNWVDHVLSGLRSARMQIRILCPGEGAQGVLDESCSFATFREGLPYAYSRETEELFRQELRQFQPDVIHSWGTEYAHTLAMVNAAEQEAMLPRLVASIQGLCSVYTGHYAEGVPYGVQRGNTFRDLVRRDNIVQQKKKFFLRGELEVAALKKIQHVIGRTDWDKACAMQIRPDVQYHFCNETLREPFYQDQWNYSTCKKHHIFAPSCVYPIKGFHYLLEALAMVCREYPDATVSVPGKSFLKVSKLRRSGYQKYLAELAESYGLAEKITFLGKCSAEEMKAAFLEANVFALPSTIENSPNSLGEAMLLGVPCVSADVGGVKNLMTHGEEGYIYQSTAPYMLAFHIRQIFAMEDAAEAIGQKAREHARKTHDPKKNLEDLMAIYEELKERSR